MEENINLYVTTLIAILTTFIIFVIWNWRKNPRKDVLIVGLCDSGKTLLFSRLLHNKFVNTYTSIKENIGHYAVQNDSLRIIDIPGHHKLHKKFFDRYKRLAKGIVYVIDSVTFRSDIRDIAEFLYSLLSDPVIISNCPRLLILCNKQGPPTSLSKKDVQRMLEKEITTLRQTKTNQLESIDKSAGEKNTFLGKQGADFEFSHINSLNVYFGEAAALNKEVDNLTEKKNLKTWLEESLI